MKTSAGVLCYRYNNSDIEVLISHMGGPYWAHKDECAWSIPKGEYKNESPEQAARREFNEETGFTVDSISFLGESQICKSKTMITFYTEANFDAFQAKSNMFEMEYPKGSGNICEFPECDRSEWVSLDQARIKLSKGQVVFLDMLKDKL